MVRSSSVTGCACPQFLQLSSLQTLDASNGSLERAVAIFFPQDRNDRCYSDALNTS